VRESRIKPATSNLLCSDGLTTMLSDADIRERLASGRTLNEICATLGQRANARAASTT